MGRLAVRSGEGVRIVTVELSVVVPALNEGDALPGLVEEIAAACTETGRRWELIIVDDGSTDGSFAIIEKLASARPQLRGVRLRSNLGKSAALAVGIDHSAGEVIVTIDGDGQDDPADIPRLIAGLESGADLVSGWKRERRDPLTRRVASKVFNSATGRFSGVRLHDMNCGLKAYRGDCARSLQIYGELHRYLPVLAAQQGWRVAELPVNHREREHGRSRFGGERYLRGGLDLLTVTFLGRYRHRPLHLFGGLGLGLTAIGLLISLYLTILKISGESIGQRPLLFLGVLLIVVGIQLLSVGLLGQMLVVIGNERRGGSAPTEGVERVIGFAEAPISDGRGRSATETSDSR